MGRYDPPDPKCKHKPKGRVTAGVLAHDQPHASTYVCDRPACIADAREWAMAAARLHHAEYVPFDAPKKCSHVVIDDMERRYSEWRGLEYWEHCADCGTWNLGGDLL